MSYSIDVNGNDNQPEWGYCDAPGCPEPAYPLWYAGGPPDDPDLLLCDRHIGARILQLQHDVDRVRRDGDEALTALQTQLAAAQVDNAGLLDILRQLDYTSSPERAERILAYVRDQEHPGRALMARALTEWNEAQQALERAETARKAAIERGAADHAIATAARAWRTARETLNGIADAEATLLAAVAASEKGVSE